MHIREPVTRSDLARVPLAKRSTLVRVLDFVLLRFIKRQCRSPFLISQMSAHLLFQDSCCLVSTLQISRVFSLVEHIPHNEVSLRPPYGATIGPCHCKPSENCLPMRSKTLPFNRARGMYMFSFLISRVCESSHQFLPPNG